MEEGQRHDNSRLENFSLVLILVVMEEGQRQGQWCPIVIDYTGLNPCCNGRGSKTLSLMPMGFRVPCLNPCCNGRGSKTYGLFQIIDELSLNPCCNGRGSKTLAAKAFADLYKGLNPCCNGRGSKTNC